MRKFTLFCFCFLIGSLSEIAAMENTKKVEVYDSQTDNDSMPEPAAEPYTSAKEYQSQLLVLVLSILGIIFVLLLIIWMFKRFSGGRSIQINHKKHMKILERRPLSPNTYLYLVQIGDQQCMIAESKFQVKHLTTLTQSEKKKENS